MVRYAGQGDPRRSMTLLWRTAAPVASRTAPGPRPGLSVDTIVDAAVAIADGQGMAALSMRAVGDRLGCTAMALYTYVATKAELVDLMYDRVFAELPGGSRDHPDWRAALTSWADGLWALHLRHPWTLTVSPARPVLGPNEYAVLDELVGILRRADLPPVRVRRMVGVLFHFVRGLAQTVVESRQAAAATGVSDERWWSGRSGLLEQVAPDFAQRFPMVTWLEQQGAPEPPDDDVPYLEREAVATFRAGLAVLLDGITAAVPHQAGDTGR